MGSLNDWDVTDANNNATPPNGWPENTMQYSEVNNTGRAMQGTLKRFFADINGSLSAAGAANAYTVTLNESGYTSYFAGMYFVCRMPATNTGASTMNVNGIGVQNILDRGGTPLAPGEIQQDGIYEFRYDGTAFQLMGTVVGTATLGAAVLSNVNNPDLTDVDVALAVGAADPTADPHIEVGSSAIQSKSDSTTAASISINALGGDVSVGAQSGAGEVIFHRSGVRRFSTASAGVEVRSDGNTDTEGRRVILAHQDGTNRAFFGFTTSGALQVANQVHGEELRLQSESSGGTLRNLFTGDPGGSSSLYNAGSLAFRTDGGGVQIIAPAINPTLDFLQNDASTRTSFIQGNISTGLLIGNEVHGTPVTITGEDAGGVIRNLFVADPDAGFDLYYGGTSRLSTALGGDIIVRSDGNTDTEGRGIRFSYANGTERGFVGYVSTGTFFIRNRVHGAAITIQAEDNGGTLRNIFTGDPDGASVLSHAGSNVARTRAIASGGLEVNNTLTGGGFERVLTTSDSMKVVKTSNQSRSGDTAEKEDSALFLRNLPVGYYTYEAVLLYNTTGSGGISVQANVSGGGTVGAGAVLFTSDVNSNNNRDINAPEGFPGANAAGVIHITGGFEVASGTPDVAVYWAQNTSNGVATTVEEGSWLRVQRIS